MRLALIYALLVGLSIGAMLPALGVSFIVLDDPFYVVANSLVRAGFNWNSVAWAFSTTYYGNWFPLTWLSYMLDIELFGFAPIGFHLTNLALHIIATVLFFKFLHNATSLRWQSAFAAALFAIHPLHVEPIVWVSSRKDVLSGVFWMLCLVVYQFYQTRPSKLRYLSLCATFILGLMAKPSLMPLPLVLLLLDLSPLKRSTLKNKGNINYFRLLIEKIPLLAISTLAFCINYFSQSSAGPDLEAGYLSLSTRIGNAFVFLCTYLWRTICPIDLAIQYPHPLDSYTTATITPAIIAIAAATLLAIVLHKAAPYLIVGWLWFALSVSPNLQIIQIGNQATADRYMYIPLAGLCIIIAWGLGSILKHLEVATKSPLHLLKNTIAISVVLYLSITTRTQLSTWQTSVTVFEHAAKTTVNNHRAYTYLGDSYQKLGDSKRAAQAYTQALKINNDFYFAFLGLCKALNLLGETDKLADHMAYQWPWQPVSYQKHIARGSMLYQLQKYQAARTKYLKQTEHSASSDAIRHLEAAVYLDPANPQSTEAENTLGILFYLNKNYQKAINVLSKVVAKQPKRISPRVMLAASLLEERQLIKARSHVKEVLRLEPINKDALALHSKLEAKPNYKENPSPK